MPSIDSLYTESRHWLTLSQWWKSWLSGKEVPLPPETLSYLQKLAHVRVRAFIDRNPNLFDQTSPIASERDSWQIVLSFLTEDRHVQLAHKSRKGKRASNQYFIDWMISRAESRADQEMTKREALAASKGEKLSRTPALTLALQLGYFKNMFGSKVQDAMKAYCASMALATAGAEVVIKSMETSLGAGEWTLGCTLPADLCDGTGDLVEFVNEAERNEIQTAVDNVTDAHWAQARPVAKMAVARESLRTSAGVTISCDNPVLLSVVNLKRSAFVDSAKPFRVDLVKSLEQNQVLAEIRQDNEMVYTQACIWAEDAMANRSIHWLKDAFWLREISDETKVDAQSLTGYINASTALGKLLAEESAELFRNTPEKVKAECLKLVLAIQTTL